MGSTKESEQSDGAMQPRLEEDLKIFGTFPEVIQVGTEFEDEHAYELHGQISGQCSPTGFCKLQ